MSLNRDGAYVAGGVVVAVAAAGAAAWSPTVGGIVLAVLLVALSTLYQPTPRVLAAAGLLVIMCSVSSPALPFGSGAVSVALRGAGAVLVLLAAAVSPCASVRPALRPMLTWFPVGLGLFILAATLPHGQVTEFVLLVPSLALLVVYTWALTRRLAMATVRDAVVASLALFVAASLLAGVLVPDAAIEQGRLRGLAENANGLGCYAFLLAAVALTAVRSRLVVVACVALSLTAIVWTGSRNTAVAVVVVAVVLGVSSLRGRVAVVAGAAATAALYSVYAPDVTSILGRLLSGDNTRAETFSYSASVLDRYPWFGVGLSNQAVEVASSPMRAIVNAGVWGALAVLIMWAAFLVAGAQGGRRSLAFVLGVVAFSVFEGTLLSPLGAGLFVTLAAFAAVVPLPRAAGGEHVDPARVPVPVSADGADPQ